MHEHTHLLPSVKVQSNAQKVKSNVFTNFLKE
jgi:hypothetical protein